MTADVWLVAAGSSAEDYLCYVDTVNALLWWCVTKIAHKTSLARKDRTKRYG